jgi:hypothetical protein
MRENTTALRAKLGNDNREGQTMKKGKKGKKGYYWKAVAEDPASRVLGDGPYATWSAMRNVLDMLKLKGSTEKQILKRYAPPGKGENPRIAIWKE